MLFIIAVEIFAISIRQDNNISGVKVTTSALTIKILQIAGDTTVFKRNETDVREVLAQLKNCTLFSGLQLNESKPNAIILSKTSAQPETICNIRCVTKEYILAV